MRLGSHDLRGDDTIDSRDVAARIDYLETEIEDLKESENDYSEEAEELEALIKLREECEDYCPDWIHGETLINDSYFEDYAKELANDCYGMIKDIKWPFTCIDWEKATEELQQDYSSVEFDGETYWYRG